MTRHIVIIAAVMLIAGAGYALPQTGAPESFATEEELLSAPGSAGYAVDEEIVVEDALESPLCDCDTDEGEDGFDHGDGADPGDGGDGPDDSGDHGTDDDEPGC
jgi:hypothetical protein